MEKMWVNDKASSLQSFSSLIGIFQIEIFPSIPEDAISPDSATAIAVTGASWAVVCPAAM